jgi:hypothetical protein
MFLRATRSSTSSRTERVTVVPSRFDGFVSRTPATRIPAAAARSYAASSAGTVTWNPFELSQCTGTKFTPVLHLRSRSNLNKNREKPRQNTLPVSCDKCRAPWQCDSSAGRCISMLDICLPRVLRSRDQQRVSRVSQDEREQLVGRRRAGGEHDAVGVEPRLAAQSLLHEARHGLPEGLEAVVVLEQGVVPEASHAGAGLGAAPARRLRVVPEVPLQEVEGDLVLGEAHLDDAARVGGGVVGVFVVVGLPSSPCKAEVATRDRGGDAASALASTNILPPMSAFAFALSSSQKQCKRNKPCGICSEIKCSRTGQTQGRAGQGRAEQNRTEQAYIAFASASIYTRMKPLITVKAEREQRTLSSQIQ